MVLENLHWKYLFISMKNGLLTKYKNFSNSRFIPHAKNRLSPKYEKIKSLWK